MDRQGGGVDPEASDKEVVMNIHSKDRGSPDQLCARRLGSVAAAVAAVLAASAAVAQQPAPQPRPPTQSPPAAVAEQRPSFLREELQEATATVTAIDAAKRLISLEDEDGRKFTVEAGEDVRNFAQVEVGDEVEVQYYQALAASIAEAEEGAGDDAVVIGERAAEGQRPGGSIGTIQTVVVTVDSVDPATSTVSFTGPGGQQREATVERPDARAFVSQLKPGDRVRLTYGESFAIAVAPTGEGRELR
jgi:hypothetical protein